MTPITILIAAGGTGGHLYPTIAVAEEIKRLEPEARVIFIGTKDRIESREVPRLGYPFFPISIAAPRKSLASMMRFPMAMQKAVLDSLRVMRSEKPRAMLGGGAYLSVPAGFAAWAMRVPIGLLEINSHAGTANRILSKFSQKLFLSYPESRSNFKGRIGADATISGSPVRGDIGSMNISASEARTAFGLDPAKETILVFGGSLGAKAINDAMRSAATELTDAGYNVLWQTGKGNDLEALLHLFAGNANVRVQEYIYEMDKAYAASNLVVCRAGASSLAELARLGKPAILVPYPLAAANHQEKNAQAFEATGAAIVLRDPELKTKLAPMALELMPDTVRRGKMTQRMKERDNPQAATVIAEWLIAQAKR